MGIVIGPVSIHEYDPQLAHFTVAVFFSSHFHFRLYQGFSRKLCILCMNTLHALQTALCE